MRDVFLTCPLDCPDACRLKITLAPDPVLGERAIKVTGDAGHPITQGFACAKTVHYPARQYHPDRPLYPMKRVGEGFVRISWDQALDEIAERLKEVLQKHGPHALLRYNYAGTMGLREGTHVHSFFRALGANELEETICATAGTEAWMMTYGPRYGVIPEDVPHARLIFLWGINSLTTNSHLTPWLKKARKNGAKIYHIDPYQNKTSLFADEHIKINPGTDAALALGFMHLIFRWGLEDRAYLEEACVGSEELREAARPYTPEKVSEITGIAVEKIEQLAREYATTTPSYIRVGYGMTRHEYGGNNLRSVLLLPAVMGQWKHRGGGVTLSTSGYFHLNRRKLGAGHLIKAETPRVNMTQLASALEPEKGIHALFVYNTNPVVVAPDTDRVIQGFKREDLLVVVLEQAMTETAKLADYLLPATTFMEHEDLYTSYGHTHLGYNPKMLNAPGEAKPNSWVFQELGKRLGLTEETLYWNMDQLLEHLLDTDHPFMQGITPEKVKQEGSVRLNVPEGHLPYLHGALTQTGKIQLIPAPHYTPDSLQPTPEFPFRLITPPAHHFLNSTYGNLSNLTQAEGGEPLALMHPEDAAHLGLEHGQDAKLSSPQGEVVRQVRLHEGVTPGVVVLEGSWWGLSARDGKSINTLTSERLTDLGAGSTFHANMIAVTKA
ncbi:molybdopterin-containing oxidoreductase family protein [Deinococcus cellulosilyticus]|uniref:Molybdopterin oxidoreductase n=1 Tax=Deinococcus cellulosilyticus (strain DSM 18568 / NBRC 106333 / KACC 11606 / 5516J-15) TaxID=1223518 RepID=A0A511N5R7_DEIC1|nr:molybdopterin oxidoreductase family protein [Deinococcus cellulosilyticus]GEM47776.1 molybdopterin oxidoreductase [Deinococcus cellulosilyticus NBRC 106333 = KACC 11606]